MKRPIAIVMWVSILLLVTIMLVFAGIRVVVDTPRILAGEIPVGEYGEMYARYPILAYLHIVPGVIFIIGALFQLSRRFRNRHLALPRALGKWMFAMGLISGIFALGFGVPFAHGGAWQSAATALFGSYFVIALLLAYQAIRRKDIRQHRRWMIRAFAIGLAVGSIRLWMGLLSGLGPLSLAEAFAPGFWLGLSMHAIAA
ncbi:MAG TPA: DUF2306 domain-containing protein, partial [Terrimesophilobacter sp.]|nr:DUF2306 domain-containing protein [Terrimesophilobacter sp.]